MVETVVAWVFLLFGVFSLAVSGLLLFAALRDRGLISRRELAGGFAFILSYAIEGVLWITAFAVPSARQGAVLAAASLKIARGLAAYVVKRVLNRRGGTSSA